MSSCSPIVAARWARPKHHRCPEHMCRSRCPLPCIASGGNGTMVKITRRTGHVSHTSRSFGTQALKAIRMPQSIETPDQALSELRNAGDI